MRLTLKFAGSNINGGGSDQVGAFKIAGIFSEETQRVLFTKTYRTHEVEYSGQWDGHLIFGRWTIHDDYYTEIGDFEIWPEEANEMVEVGAATSGETLEIPLAR
jgi:hypothetical protein